jgi:hypothetical protein
LNEAVELLVCDMAGATVRDAGQVAQAFTPALAADRNGWRSST